MGVEQVNILFAANNWNALVLTLSMIIIINDACHCEATGVSKLNQFEYVGV
jgi:hypothetical protein